MHMKLYGMMMIGVNLLISNNNLIYIIMKKLLFVLLIICFICISCDDDSYRGRIVDIRCENGYMTPYGYNNLYRGIPDTYKIIVVNKYKKNRKYRAFSFTNKGSCMVIINII